MRTMPLTVGEISLVRDSSGTVTFRPQKPLALRRLLVLEAPYTAALQQIDSIIADAIASGVMTHAAYDPDPEPEADPNELTTVGALLRRERATLHPGWTAYSGGLWLDELRVGNVLFLSQPVGIDVMQTVAGGVRIAVPVAENVAMQLRNVGPDREFMGTWFCDVP